jgi:hypothetical protein
MNGNGALASFLTRLSDDPQLQQAYVNDPEGTLRDAGVSDDTIGTILSRDLSRVKAVLEKELSGLHYMMFMVVFDPPNP